MHIFEHRKCLKYLKGKINCLKIQFKEKLCDLSKRRNSQLQVSSWAHKCMKFIKMSLTTNYDYSLTLITFQLMWNSRYYQLLLCWDRQLGNTVEGRKGTTTTKKTLRMMNRECYLKNLQIFFFFWYGLCWTFSLLICFVFSLSSW